MEHSPKDLNEEFNVGSRSMSKLLAKATPADGDSGRMLEYYDNGRLAKYSIQFQGCHHVRHWNSDADDGDEDDVRVYTKRLVRFRLVPYEHCSAYNPWMDNTALNKAQDLIGKADYGDYIVDMGTFINAYLEAREEAEASNGGDDDNYGYEADDGDDGFQIADYTQCAAFDFADQYDNAYGLYVGPYCANQGGEIKLNLFVDNTCTTVAKCGNGGTRGANCYTQLTGKTIPYTQESIVENPCVPCSVNYSYLDSAPNDEIDFESYDFGYTRDVCTNLYDEAGKCEKHMQNGKYNYACSYMKGIKMGVSSEGYAVAVKRSLPADAALATLAISTTFIGMYIYYLKHKLSKVEAKNYSNNFYVPSRING